MIKQWKKQKEIKWNKENKEQMEINKGKVKGYNRNKKRNEKRIKGINESKKKIKEMKNGDKEREIRWIRIDDDE